ncbi:MAG TPA: ABC transporter permease, partial [Polyangiaceae bacterium]|nr:ABC transporter permease [Polyangiaceae bacterium]
IGVGAVIALVTIGQATTQKVTADIGKLGNNLLTVSVGANRRGGGSVSAPPFTMEDVEAIEREVTGIAALAPAAGSSALIVYGNRNWRSQISGTTNEYFMVRGYSFSAGRSFSEEDLAGGRPVCIIGATTKQELFGGTEALGEQVRIDKLSCEVIGVLVAKGQAGFGQDQDDLVVMPLKTFQRRVSGNRDIASIFVSAAEGRSTAAVKAQLESLMRQRRRIGRGAEDNFSVRDMKEIAETVASTAGALTALLGAIAAVSLLVGGIGIMNIMLVSVTERTREIGIRMAIGARGREVLLQFLVEAVMLSTIGGTIGMLLGLGGSYVTVRYLDTPFVIVPEVVIVAFLFSAMVGVCFGYLPARKAARLNPIEALRHE